MQQFIVSPNAFKHSLDAGKAAEAICRGLLKSRLPCRAIPFPVGDGGDGTCSLIHHNLNGEWMKVTVSDPLGRPVQAAYSLINGGETAAIEMADASGIRLLRTNERHPMLTSSEGTGEMILHALDQGVKRIILGMGGSATTDGGCGMLHALGMRFLDQHGKVLKPVPQELRQVYKIDISGLDERILEVSIIILCDVQNVLLGPEGAARVFGPQKGADESDIIVLEKMLRNLSNLALEKMGKDITTIPSGGTAGGAAAGMYAFANARLVNGIDYFLEVTQFEEQLQDADWVVTGEGKIDEQTLAGKGPFGVAKLAKKYNIPVIGMAGSIPLAPSVDLLDCFDVLLPINNEIIPLDKAFNITEENLMRTAASVGNLLAAKERRY